jgi:hypothetical protein
MQHSQLGFGVTGNLPLDTVRAISRRAGEIGLASLWFNETPDGDALARAEIAFGESTALVVGTGVIAVDRRPAEQIVREVVARNLPQERLIVGIGSSAKPRPLATVAANLDILRSDLSAKTVVGSLGPKMRQLGAERSNGLLFNWLPPAFATETTATLRAQAAAAGNGPVIGATYIRTALGDDALPRLHDEAAKYSSIPSYAANFERLGITAMQSAVHAPDAENLRNGLLAFDGAVDHVIVRAITPTDDVDHYLRLLEAIAPLV